MKPEDRALVHRHIAELRQLAVDGVITNKDHNVVGEIICEHIDDLVNISVIAWDKFKSIIEETRKAAYK